MNSQLDSLVRISKSSFEAAIDLLVQAFWKDPLNIYFYPNEETRKELLPVFFRYRLKQGILGGEVWATSLQFEGLAIWKYSRTVDRSLWRDIRAGGLSMYRKFGGELIKRMSDVDKFTTQRIRQYSVTPYMHLGPIAVQPELQGQGYASKLLRPMFEIFDRDGMNCYLETQSESNVKLYEYFGFEVLAEGIVPNTGIPHWDMIRHPE
ncbi:MAG: GNAT family N-acetyltransferase [Candidatus Thorarchaeota archaeon]